MKLGIMQPYFFPYVGYFDLINQSDDWVVFDCVQYTPKSWMNRNRILHPKEGWQYITVPVRTHGRDTLIHDVLVVDKAAACRRMLGQIEHYRKRRAPYFEVVRDLIEQCFAQAEGERLRDLNVVGLQIVCAYLDIPFTFRLLSEMQLPLPPIEYAGQWALEIAAALGAAQYINSPNGRGLFCEEEFARRGIALRFTSPNAYRYACAGSDCIEDLSIIDALMWNPPEAIKAHLNSTGTFSQHL